MKMVRCSNGHYYDEEKHPQCPQCSQFSIFGNQSASAMSQKNGFTAEDDIKTVSYAEQADEGVTVAFNSFTDKTEDLSDAVPFDNAPVFMPVVGWLVCTEGPERGRDYRLCAGRNFIGRDLSMDICIREDMTVSRENHASIIFDDRSCRFIVLSGDSTLTMVNGEEVYGPRDLQENDRIRIGKSEFCFIPYCTNERKWG